MLLYNLRGEGDGDGEDGDHIILYSIQYAPHQLPPAETRNNLGCNEVSLTNLITEPANTGIWKGGREGGREDFLEPSHIWAEMMT